MTDNQSSMVTSVCLFAEYLIAGEEKVDFHSFEQFCRCSFFFGQLYSQTNMKKLILVCVLLIACAYAFNIDRLAEEIAEYITEADTEASLCTSTAVNLRSGPCTTNSIITTASAGATVNSLNEKKTACGYDWIKVSINGKTGWMASQYVKSCGGSSPSSGGQDCGEAFEQGRSLGRKTCTTIDGKPVVVSTAEAFNKMKSAAASAGVHLRINSGFRTMKEQEYFVRIYLSFLMLFSTTAT